MNYKVVTTKNIISLSSGFQNSQKRERGIPRMGLIHAPTGFGKTTAAAWLVNRENGIYVRAVSLWSPMTMLMAIATELSLATSRYPAKLLQDIVAQMKLNQRPLFIDEADYLFHNPRMIDAARDIHDLSELPVWLIGSHKLEKQIAQRKIVAGRISEWVKFLPCDLSDAHLLAKELCLVEVQADLLEQLHKAAKGSIRLITVGLSRIEATARMQQWDTINAQQWGKQPFFFTRQVDYSGRQSGCGIERKSLGTLGQLSCSVRSMPKAYSQDLREKAIAAIDRGMPKSEVITIFNISRDSLDRWLKRRTETGNITAIQGYQRGHSHRIVDWERFRAFVRRHGDKTQAELAELWHEPVSARTISRALAHIGLTRKKRLTATANAMK